MKTTTNLVVVKLARGRDRVLFCGDKRRVLMSNSRGEDLHLTAAEAVRRILTLRAAGWTSPAR